MPEHLSCHFSCCYIYFWQIYSPKTVSVEHANIFKLRFGEFLDIARKWKWYFWNAEIKLAQKHTFFVRENQFENLALCDPGLTRPFSVVGLYGVNLQDGPDFWILRAKVTINHVLHARKRFFYSGDISWPFVTWPWPWPVLSMALMFIGHLH